MKTDKKYNRFINHFTFFFLVLYFLQSSFHTFAQNDPFPYTMKRMDYALVPIGIAVKYLSSNWVDQLDIMTMEEISGLDKASVNRFDRPAIDNFSLTYDNISDILRTSLVLLPSSILIHQSANRNWNNTLTYGMIYLEAYLYTRGITDFVKTISKRKRPYLYNNNLTVEERYEFTKQRDSYGSFFSGHTTAVFASAVCFSKTFEDIYGKSVWSKAVWTTTLTTASIVGYCRYASGEHFPTDVIAGAVIGSAVGYIVPVIHKSPAMKNLSLSMNPGILHLTYTF